MTTNKRDIRRMISVIDSASLHARTTYFVYLVFTTYCIIAALGTSDKQLALKGEHVHLPLINIAVPLDWFFIIAPIIMISLFSYLMFYLLRLNTLVLKLEDEYIAQEKFFDKRDLYPSILNIVRAPEEGTVGFLQSIFVSLTLWFTLPTALIIFTRKFVKKHDEFRSYLIVIISFVSIFIVYWFWNKFRSRKFKEQIIYGVFIAIACIIALAFIPSINEGDFTFFNLNLRNEKLVKVPSRDENFQQEYWVDLEGVNLNGADLRNAVLQKSNLVGARLKNAQIQNSNLQEANLEGSDLTGAILRDTNLVGATLVSANLSDAYLVGADLDNADLANANLESSNLGGAKLLNTNLIHANLKNSAIYATDIRRTKNLTFTQLCGVSVLNSVTMNGYLLRQIEDKKEGCPNILTNENYEKWLKEQQKKRKYIKYYSTD